MDDVWLWETEGFWWHGDYLDLSGLVTAPKGKAFYVDLERGVRESLAEDYPTRREWVLRRQYSRWRDGGVTWGAHLQPTRGERLEYKGRVLARRLSSLEALKKMSDVAP